jgi:hypothetical protein
MAVEDEGEEEILCVIYWFEKSSSKLYRVHQKILGLAL